MKRTITGLLAIALSLITGTALWAVEQAPSGAEPQQKTMEQPPSVVDPQKKAVEQVPPVDPQKKAMEQAPSAMEPQQKAVEQVPPVDPPKKAMEQTPPVAEPPKKAMEQAPPGTEPQKKAMEQAPSAMEPQQKAMEQAPPVTEPQKKTGTMPQTASPATATIQGQVLKIESDSLIVSTGGGGQVRLKLDGNTKIQGSPKVGDKVEAELSPERSVLSLKVSE